MIKKTKNTTQDKVPGDEQDESKVTDSQKVSKKLQILILGWTASIFDMNFEAVRIQSRIQHRAYGLIMEDDKAIQASTLALIARASSFVLVDTFVSKGQWNTFLVLCTAAW